MVYVTRRSTFSASHRLYNPALSDTENEAIFGNCSNKNGHGHNYTVEVTVVGQPQDRTGYVIDLKKLKEVLRREIIERVDHRNLNLDVGFLQGIIPTAENIVKAFWKVLAPKIKEGKLYSIRLHETENNVVEYRGE
jgi:6-pyruvoyltetrahydropterin/6-carboxytetrahydropterin synthase